MKTYYDILEVSQYASDSTIHTSYRALAKKFHPDVYKGDLNEANLKMCEINKAYDTIMNERTGAGSYTNRTGYNGSYSSSNSSATGYGAVRNLISQNRIMEAQTMLSGLPKNAEWYYLNGLICLRRGWYDQAITNINQACSMDPGNIEYRSTLNNIQNRNTTYRTNPMSNTGCYICPMDCCTALMCADCMCPCFGCM